MGRTEDGEEKKREGKRRRGAINLPHAGHRVHRVQRCFRGPGRGNCCLGSLGDTHVYLIHSLWLLKLRVEIEENRFLNKPVADLLKLINEDCRQIVFFVFFKDIP